MIDPTAADPTAADPTAADAQRPAPPPTPGERRLAHPPSDRYRTAEPTPPAEDPAATPARGMAFAIAAAAAGAVAMTVLGGVMAVSAGLLIVAGATGWAVAVGLRSGGGKRLAAGRRVGPSLALTLLSVALGQLGLWLFALTEGGVLGPLDYLAQTFGLLVPLELAVAWIVAWAVAR